MKPIRTTRPRRALLAAASALAAAVAASACGGGTGEPGTAQAPAAPPDLDGVVEEHLTREIAVVNGAKVYQAAADAILVALRETIPPDANDSVERYVGAKRRSFDRAVDEELLFQEAVRRGFDPPREEVRRVYSERILKAGSEEAYLAAARRSALSKFEVLESIRRTLALDRFVKSEVEAAATATDEEVRAFYDSRPDLFTPDPWLRIGQIFMEAPASWPSEKRAAVLSRMGDVLEQMRKGRSFESLARDHSQDEAAANGGMLGYFRRGNLPAALDRAVFSIQPGQITDIVETQGGYHIAKVYEMKGGRLQPFDEVREEARKRLLARKRNDAIGVLLVRLRQAAVITWSEASSAS